MKWVIFYTFTLNLILFINVSYAQNQNKDEQEKDQFKKDAQDIYRSVDISRIVPYEAFFKGYVGYQKYRRRLNGSPIITFLNYSIPSNQQRLVTVDFKKRTTPFVSHAAHGRNSSSDEGAACSKVDTVKANNRSIPACQPFMGVPAVSFSDRTNSLQSSLGFILVGEHNFGKVVGKSLILKGLEDSNQGIQSREILFHSGNYVEIGGNSWGCIAIPPDLFSKGYELLKNNTLLFSFEGSKFSGAGTVAIPQSIPEPTTVSEEELKEAVVSSKDQNYSSTPDVSNVKRETPPFEELDIAKAPPSKAGLSMGLTAVGGAVVTLKSSNKSKKNSTPPETLKGSSKYEECQKLSDAPWEDTVTDINAGENPSNHFKGSWNELHQTLKNESVDNGPAIDRAEERLAIINDCVASAHISERTNFDKQNINQPDKKSSEDGSITCVYEGPESQDYQACLETIAAHDSLLQQEAAAHAKQEVDFKASSEKKVKQVTGENAQSLALDQFTGLQIDHSNIAHERADISIRKIDQLAAIASRIPTTDSLYDECKSKFAKHGTVSIDEYNQFAKIYSASPKTFNAERDYCLSAVSTSVKPIQNQNAREEVKNVLKKFGREMEVYSSKSSALLNRSSLTPDLNSSSFGIALTDLKLNSEAQELSGGVFQGNPQDGLMLTNSGSSKDKGGAAGTSFLINPNVARIQELGLSGVASSAANGTQQGGSSFKGTYGNVGSYKGAGGTSGAFLGNGIYNEEFNRKIESALRYPQNLAELKLSPPEMKEYLERKKYNELMARSPNEVAGRTPASSTVVIKDETPKAISAKEQNIFEIISIRYAKKFFNGL
ncbi:MAG: murein L,D-transpeptidase catalytic domain family protein [Bacteriovorax sp.]|nr:murein L,D-transpeptidase catalytic domain family protein [Bacteriovorax sp.]